MKFTEKENEEIAKEILVIVEQLGKKRNGNKTWHLQVKEKLLEQM